MEDYRVEFVDPGREKTGNGVYQLVFSCVSATNHCFPKHERQNAIVHAGRMRFKEQERPFQASPPTDRDETKSFTKASRGKVRDERKTVPVARLG